MQPVNTPYAELVGDGSSTEIEFDFSVDIASTSPSGSQSYPRVRLITYDEDTGALESVETLTYGTDYTVALTAKDSEAGDLAYPGGTITLTEAPETYQTAYVDRVSPLTQSTIFPTGGQLNLRTLEAKIDYLTRIAQEQGLDISRIPVSDDPTAEPVLWYATEDDWGKYASLDLSGNAVFVTEVETGTLTLTNQGNGRVGYGGATDEIRFDAGFEYDEAMNTVKLGGLTASRAVVTDANKKLVSSGATAQQVGYLSNVTSDVQGQLDAKLPVASPSATGTVTATQGTAGNAVQVLQSTHADGNPSETVYQNTVETDPGDSPVTILTIPVATGEGILIDVVMVGKDLGGADIDEVEAGWGKAVARNIGGTVTIRGTPVTYSTGDSGVLSSGPTFSVSGTNVLVRASWSGLTNVRATARVYPCG